MRQKIFTLEKSYREGVRKLQEAGVPDAKLDAWYLLEHVTGVSRAYYLGHPDQEMDEDQEEKYQELIARRQQRIPLQHETSRCMYRIWLHPFKPSKVVPGSGGDRV